MSANEVTPATAEQINASVDLANKIETVIAGQEVGMVLIAFGMMLGAFASYQREPYFALETMLDNVGHTAEQKLLGSLNGTWTHDALVRQ